MAKVNLSKLDLRELKSLQKDVDKAISEYEQTRRKDAIAAAQRAARKFGFSLAELTGTKIVGRAIVPPKYRHPEHPELTWSGRGRRPKWLIEALDGGMATEDFEID